MDKYLGNVQLQKLACQQATAFRLPASQLKKDGLWITPSCLEVLGCRDYLTPKDFKVTQDYQEVWCEEMVVLTLALQRCAVHSRTPPGVICWAVQDLCKCLAPMVESGDQIDLEMLDVVKRDPVVPASTERS